MGNQTIEGYSPENQSSKGNGKSMSKYKRGWQMYQKAKKLRKERKYDEALTLLDMVYKIFKKQKQIDPTAFTLMEMGLIYVKMGRVSEGIGYYKKSLKRFKTSGNKKGIAEVCNNLGLAHKREGSFKEAIRCYNKSIAIKEQLKDIKGEGKTLSNIASLCKELGKFDQALKYYEQALKIFRNFEENKLVGLTLKEINLLKRDLENKSLIEKKKIMEEMKKNKENGVDASADLKKLSKNGDNKQIMSIIKKKEAEKQLIQEELEKLQDEKNCVICLENPKNILFLPCKHISCCSECSSQVKECPMCRAKIDQKIETYL